MKALAVLMEGHAIGVLQHNKGRLAFDYDSGWIARPNSYPLSLSMPMASRHHPHSAVEPFLWGLLPDSDFILSRWAQRFHVSPRNAFALLANVGEDCAGAVQFISPGSRGAAEGEIAWMTEADVARRLRDLALHVDAWRIGSDMGQFSLAGAQPKTALLFDGERWGVPSGRVPTTHILKPPAGDLAGHAENEHLCLRLAQALGLPAARSEVRLFEDMKAIVVERYDRVRSRPLAEAARVRAAAKAVEVAEFAASAQSNAVVNAAADAGRLAANARVTPTFSEHAPIYRVHQEDVCQALGVHPSQKYQNEGGPGPKQVVDLLAANVSAGRRDDRTPSAVREADVWVFLEALVFNWVIGGTDAHAKNYSILLGGDGLVRLAPLYDVSSVFAYPHLDPRRSKLAMRIGRRYALLEIGLKDWETLAAELRIDPVRLTSRIKAMAAELPDRLSKELTDLRRVGVSHPVLDRLATILPERAAQISRS